MHAEVVSNPPADVAREHEAEKGVPQHLPST